MIALPPHAITFPALVQAKIDFASAMLKNEGLAGIPEDYMAFLRQTDGAIALDAEFYGCEAQSRQTYKYPSLLEANAALIKSKNEFAAGNLLVGTCMGSALFYEPSRGYMLRSRFSFAPISAFATFDEAVAALC